MKLYRSYYRCYKCHSKLIFLGNYFFPTTEAYCPKHGLLKKHQTYRCVHYYWYGLLFLTLRDIWRRIVK